MRFAIDLFPRRFLCHNRPMRWIILTAAIGLTAACSSVTQYDPNAAEPPTSNIGSEGGGGVQTSIWSTDPSKKTLLGAPATNAP
jgi:hypothetical protein